MKPIDHPEKLIRDLHVLDINTNDEMDRRILHDTLKLQQEFKQTKLAGAQPYIWRTIMKSPITKIAATALIVVALSLSINILDKSTTTAYAIEQTIKASHTVRYLYVKGFAPAQNEPIEIWVEFNERGQLENMRIHKPAWMDPDEGTTEIVWKDNKAQIWSKKENALITTTDKNLSIWILNLLEQFDPKLAMERLEKEKKQGNIEVQIEQPGNNLDPIIITATYLRDNNSPFQRMVLLIDQASKLVNSVKLYQLQDGEYQKIVTFEYYNYNEIIEPEVFSLDHISSDITHENIIK